MFIDFIQSCPHVHKFQPILSSNIFFSAWVLGEVLVVDELHYYDAPESSSMGVKRNCMPSYELWTPSPPLILDANFEGFEPLETFATTKGGHAPNRKKQKKYEITMWIRGFRRSKLWKCHG